MYRKGHFIPIFVCSVIATLILGTFAPAFSENGDEFTLQLLHAADMEGDIEALENAPLVLINIECTQSRVRRYCHYWSR